MQRGFSLFEVLVVLVILGLTSTIAFSLVTQIRANLERFFPASEYFTRLELKTGMLSRTIENFIPAREKREEFAATETEIVGLSTYFPGQPWPAERSVRLRITQDRGEVQVWADALNADKSKLTASIELLRLPCEQGSFRFLNADIVWVAKWEQSRTWPYLPLAIRFSCESKGQEMHVIAPIEREGITIFLDRGPPGGTLQ